MNTSVYVSQRTRLASRHHLLACTACTVYLTMATEVQTVPVINGINGHGASKAKAKSKNQLRREKLKQKKVALASAPVRRVFCPLKHIANGVIAGET